MGAAGAAAVLYAKEAKALKDEGKVDEAKAFIKEKEDEYNKLFANPYNAARYGYIDDVIEPRNTRFRIIRALTQLENKKLHNPAKKHGNIPLYADSTPVPSYEGAGTVLHYKLLIKRMTL